MNHRVVGWIGPIGRLAVCAALAACVGGCPPPGKLGMRDIPPPPKPPAVPVAQPTPIDMALRQSARDVIRTGLTDPQELTRAHCFEAVGDVARSDPTGPDYSPALIAALHDPSELVRFSAALTIGKLKMQAAHDPLLADLNDPSKKVRVAARYALHMLGDKRHSHDLETLSRDPDPTVRGSTAEVLGMMNEPSAVKLLKPMRLDSDVRVRQEADEALWRLGDDDGKNDLIALSVDNFADDRGFAYLALAEPRNTEARDDIYGGLTTEWEEVNLVAARALGMLGFDDGYTIAMNAAGRSETRDRLLAALALGAIGRNDEQPVLAKLLKDENPAVRVAAATAILQLHT